jgi:outer membrane protein OmpA-like peptidoglycan-associated protein
MRVTTAFLPWLLVLGSCSSPPRPPTVNESMKRPANAQIEVDLQICKNDLQNTRIQANESGRLAESTAATLASLAPRQQVLAAAQPTRQELSTRPNSIYTIRFDFGATRVMIPDSMATALIEEAKAAPLVVLRGRTDGTIESPAESSIARKRAVAVRDYLIGAGVDAARIRATHQPVGDHIADNDTPTGRGLNRRVEIEVYQVVPIARTGTSIVAAP